LALGFVLVGAFEVGAEAGEVEGHAGQDVLNVGFGQAAVAGVAQVGSAYGLGDGALDPGA
jgi:hypothetical protein